MAIYQPPKQTAAGGILKASGQGLMAAGGTVALATGATGVGAVVGGVMAGVGAIASGIGTIIDGNQEERMQKYQASYQNRLTAENNLRVHKQNNEQAMTDTQGAGVNQSVQRINAYLTPSSGGTGIINQRLV